MVDIGTSHLIETEKIRPGGEAAERSLEPRTQPTDGYAPYLASGGASGSWYIVLATPQSTYHLNSQFSFGRNLRNLTRLTFGAT